MLPALDLSVSQAARDLGIARQNLHRILSCQAAITPYMALRLEKLCGIPSRFWLARQQLHELQQATEEIRALLPGIPSYELPRGLLEKLQGEL